MRLRLAMLLPLFAPGSLLLSGCGPGSGTRLGSPDMKFAAIYSEYLSRSGTLAGRRAAASGTVPHGLDSVFVRHGLDQRAFDARIRAYSKNPRLWHEVIVQVRKNLGEEQ